MQEKVTWIEFVRRHFITMVVAPIALIGIMSRDATTTIIVGGIYAIILAGIGYTHSVAD